MAISTGGVKKKTWLTSKQASDSINSTGKKYRVLKKVDIWMNNNEQ